MQPGARQREARASSRAVSTDFFEPSIPIRCLSEVQTRLDFPSIPGLPLVFDIEIAVRAQSFHHVGDSGHAPYKVPDVGVAASQLFPSENPWPFTSRTSVRKFKVPYQFYCRGPLESKSKPSSFTTANSISVTDYLLFGHLGSSRQS